MINALGNIAAYIPVGRDHSVLYDFISKMLEMYVNIGLEAKKLSDKTGLLKATNSAGLKMFFFFVFFNVCYLEHFVIVSNPEGSNWARGSQVVFFN